MYCKYCGTKIKGSENYCNKCGGILNNQLKKWIVKKKNILLNQFKRFFIQEEKNEQLSKSVEDALEKFQNKSRYWLVAGTILSLLMMASLLFFEDRDIMYISLYITASIVFIAYNGFVEYKGVFQQIIDTLRSLWDRNIIRDTSTDKLEANYCKFIDTFNYSLNSPSQWIFCILSIMFIWFLMYIVKFHNIDDVTNYFTDDHYKILHFISDFFISIAFGCIVWQFFVIGFHISRLGDGDIFDLVPQSWHHDGCGGLSPLGDLSLRIVVIISIIGILLAGWSLIIGIYGEEMCKQDKYKNNCENYGHLLPIYLVVPISVALISFFWPLLNVHKLLVAKWGKVQKDLDRLNQTINQLEDNMINLADKLELEKSEETAKKLRIIRQTYERNRHYSTWPFNIGILKRLALYQTLQIFVLLWNFIPLKDFLSHILQVLKHY